MEIDIDASSKSSSEDTSSEDSLAKDSSSECSEEDYYDYMNMHDEDANDNVSDTQNYDCATVNDTITLKGLQDRFLFLN